MKASACKARATFVMRCREGLFDNVPTPTAHPSPALGPIDNGAGAVVGISGSLLLHEAADTYSRLPSLSRAASRDGRA